MRKKERQYPKSIYVKARTVQIQTPKRDKVRQERSILVHCQNPKGGKTIGKVTSPRRVDIRNYLHTVRAVRRLILNLTVINTLSPLINSQHITHITGYQTSPGMHSLKQFTNGVSHLAKTASSRHAGTTKKNEASCALPGRQPVAFSVVDAAGDRHYCTCSSSTSHREILTVNRQVSTQPAQFCTPLPRVVVDAPFPAVSRSCVRMEVVPW